MKDEIRELASLRLKTSTDPVETVELDLDSLEIIGYDGSFGFIKYALGSYAKDHPETTATIYSYEGMSANSGQPHWSVFLGVVGNHKKEVRAAIQFGFTGFVGVSKSVMAIYREKEIHDKTKPWARNPSDYINLEVAEPLYHIEDGRVWMEYEPFSWHSLAEWAEVADED